MVELRHEHLGIGMAPDPANSVRARLQAGYAAVMAQKAASVA